MMLGGSRKIALDLIHTIERARMQFSVLKLCKILIEKAKVRNFPVFVSVEVDSFRVESARSNPKGTMGANISLLFKKYSLDVTESA